MIMESTLEKGQYTIKMDFRAWLTNDLAGLYKSSYKRKNGKEVYVTYINNTFIKLLEHLQSYFLSYARKGEQWEGTSRLWVEARVILTKKKKSLNPFLLYHLFMINAGLILGENSI